MLNTEVKAIGFAQPGSKISCHFQQPKGCYYLFLGDEDFFSLSDVKVVSEDLGQIRREAEKHAHVKWDLHTEYR